MSQHTDRATSTNLVDLRYTNTAAASGFTSSSASPTSLASIMQNQVFRVEGPPALQPQAVGVLPANRSAQ